MLQLLPGQLTGDNNPSAPIPNTEIIPKFPPNSEDVYRNRPLGLTTIPPRPVPPLQSLPGHGTAVSEPSSAIAATDTALELISELAVYRNRPFGLTAIAVELDAAAQLLAVQAIGVRDPSGPIANGDTVPALPLTAYRNRPLGLTVNALGNEPVAQSLPKQAIGVNDPSAAIANGDTVSLRALATYRKRPLGLTATPRGLEPVVRSEFEQAIGVKDPSAAIANGDTEPGLKPRLVALVTYRNRPSGLTAPPVGSGPVLQSLAEQAIGVNDPSAAIANGNTESPKDSIAYRNFPLGVTVTPCGPAEARQSLPGQLIGVNDPSAANENGNTRFERASIMYRWLANAGADAHSPTPPTKTATSTADHRLKAHTRTAHPIQPRPNDELYATGEARRVRSLAGSGGWRGRAGGSDRRCSGS